MSNNNSNNTTYDPKAVDDYSCSDCPEYCLNVAVVVCDTRSDRNRLSVVCPWCLSSQLWQQHWKICGVHYTETKSAINKRGFTRVEVVSKGTEEKAGEMHYKYGVQYVNINTGKIN